MRGLRVDVKIQGLGLGLWPPAPHPVWAPQGALAPKVWAGCGNMSVGKACPGIQGWVPARKQRGNGAQLRGQEGTRWPQLFAPADRHCHTGLSLSHTDSVIVTWTLTDTTAASFQPMSASPLTHMMCGSDLTQHTWRCPSHASRWRARPRHQPQAATVWKVLPHPCAQESRVSVGNHPSIQLALSTGQGVHPDCRCTRVLFSWKTPRTAAHLGGEKKP